MKKVLLIFIIFSLLNVELCYSSAIKSKFNIQKEGQIKLEADEVEYLRDTKKILLNGNVFVQKDDLNFYADNMIVNYIYENNKINIIEIKAKGNVEADNNDVKMSSDDAILDMKQNILTLLNNVEIIDGESIAYSEKIIYNLITKNISISGKEDTKKRVKIIIDDIKKVQEKYGN